jgi:hypothetical protein
MKLAIIPVDGAVYVDGISHAALDLSVAPTNVHALQWNNNKGWIEFIDNEDGTKPQNQPITELPQWALDCVQVYQDWIAELARLEEEANSTIPVTVVE